LDQIEDYIDNHDDFNQCGNEFTIAGSTHTANYEYDTTYLLLALFLQVLPFFLTFVLVCVKFGTDYIRCVSSHESEFQRTSRSMDSFV
jgi:hypothetical protein